MGIRNRATGQAPFSVGDLITYAPNGDVERVVDRWDTTRPVVGDVVEDADGVVTYNDWLPAPVLRRVASGATATPGRPAVAAGPDGLGDAPRLGSGSTAHWVHGVWAGGGSGGDEVPMHPLPHWCSGGDVE